MLELLQEVVSRYSEFVELRYHKRTSNQFVATKSRVDVANHSVTEGVGIRVLVDGSFGFAATAIADEKAIHQGVLAAIASARALGKGSKKIATIADGRFYHGSYTGPGFEDLRTMKSADKLQQIVDYERQLAANSRLIETARCRYSELLEEKTIVTSDGAGASMKIALPEFSLSAIAANHGEKATAASGAGVSGNWQCLFAHPALEAAVEDTAQKAVDLITAKHPKAGKKNCILAPAVVGLLCHEAVGHTVEADFVAAGSVAQGKLGEMVASELVSMADSGMENIAGYAVGNLPFDDEGVKTETTTIIDNGKLVSYLHNRESAAEMGVAPTGNARAWHYNDEPLIRMRNTYFLPGERKLADMIAEMDDGYLIEGSGGGQADSNGEFMFGCGWVWEIKNGKKTNLLREATLSGIAFDVLKTVDAVSEEFRWDLGTGYCGKGQPAKVDAGGPYVRCKITVGGEQ